MENTWQKGWKPSKIYPKLTHNLETEVVVVGGGVTGITVAYLLAKGGKKVVVLDKGELKTAGATAYTTAMLTGQVDTSYSDLVRIFGKDDAVKIWRSGTEALDAIEKNIVEEKIECEFMRVPLYTYANDKKEWESIQEDGEILKASGFNIEFHDHGFQLGIPNLGYYIFKNQAKFHPLKYCEGLRRAAEIAGAQFYENTEAQEIEGKNPVSVKTKEGKVLGKWLVIATYDPFNKPKELFAKKGVYTSYMLEVVMPKGKIREGLYVDYYSPYHYLRADDMENETRILIGGADHRHEIKIDPAKSYTDVEEYANKILGRGNYKITNRWSGPIVEPWDGIPFIGSCSEDRPNFLVATAFSGNGFTYSRTASQIIADKVLGKENPYAHIFDPKRNTSLKALTQKGRDYMEVLFHGALKNSLRN